MAAILEKNNLSGKPTVLPDSLTNSEALSCTSRSCQVSYTLAWGVGENRIEGSENVLDVMRRKARVLLEEEHPVHGTDTYVWGGVKNGWLDREQARAAGL
jgi:hypothetical protein